MVLKVTKDILEFLAHLDDKVQNLIFAEYISITLEQMIYSHYPLLPPAPVGPPGFVGDIGEEGPEGFSYGGDPGMTNVQVQ